MEGSFARPRPYRVAYQFNDPVEFTSALPGGRFECLPWRGEAFDTKVELLQLPGLSLRTTDSAPHVARAALDAGTTTLFIQRQRGDAGLRFNGMVMPRSAVGIAAGGIDLTMVAERRVSGTILQLPFSLTDGFCDGWSVQLTDEVGVQLLDAEPASRRLADELRAAASMLGDPSDTRLMFEHVEGLGLSLREQIASALAVAGGPRRPQRALREAVRILRQVDELLFSRISEPIYTTQVCGALQISPRKLHDAMIATCGMSPHAYLKIRRLMLARRALRSAAQEAKLVKSIALALGFWHLGNFSRDYRDLFGETPSETLTRAVGPHGARDLERV